MEKAIYVDTRFCHNGPTYAENITLERLYKCPICREHVFEHHFKPTYICNECGEELYIDENK